MELDSLSFPALITKRQSHLALSGPSVCSAKCPYDRCMCTYSETYQYLKIIHKQTNGLHFFKHFLPYFLQNQLVLNLGTGLVS